MPIAPNFDYQVLPTATQGWNGIADANMSALRTFLSLQPTAKKRAYRVSASLGGTDYPDKIALVNFDPTNFQGCEVYLLDPEGSEKPHVYSDGTNWRYVLTNNTVTIS